MELHALLAQHRTVHSALGMYLHLTIASVTTCTVHLGSDCQVKVNDGASIGALVLPTLKPTLYA